MPSNEQRRKAARRKLARQLARRAQRARRRRIWAVTGSAAAVILIVAVVVTITVLGGSGRLRAAAPATDAAEAPQRPEPLPATVACSYPDSGQPAAGRVDPPEDTTVATTGTVAVTLETNAGPIPATLNRALAPCTVHSFLSLVRQDFYEDTPCHRLTKPKLTVLQCGNPAGTGTGGPGYTVPDEVFPGLQYKPGYLVMGNAGEPDSGGSQFFIVYGTTTLPPEYTVFGTVSDRGLATVQQIAQAGVEGGGTDGEPAKQIRILEVTTSATKDQPRSRPQPQPQSKSQPDSRPGSQPDVQSDVQSDEVTR